jgi:hypothetical protein
LICLSWVCHFEQEQIAAIATDADEPDVVKPDALGPNAMEPDAGLDI